MLVGLAMLVTGIVVVGGHRAWGITAMAVGALILLAPVAAVTWMFTLGSRQPHAWVQGLNPDTDPWLIVEVRNSRSIQDGDLYAFTPHMSEEAFLALLEEQHPDGEAGGSSFWHLSADDVRYDIVASGVDDSYELATQVVVVTPDPAGPKQRIAFPSSALDVRTIAEDTPLSTTWTPADWIEFYEDIDLAVVAPDSVTVPTNRGNTATVSFADGKVTVTLND